MTNRCVCCQMYDTIETNISSFSREYLIIYNIHNIFCVFLQYNIWFNLYTAFPNDKRYNFGTFMNQWNGSHLHSINSIILWVLE